MEDLLGEEREFIDLYQEHTGLVKECLNSFVKAMKEYIDSGLNENSRKFIDEVNRLESEADDVRRDIIRLLIDKRFLLSNTRRDFLTLLEYTDKVADFSEGTLDYLIVESMDISREGKEKLFNIMEITLEMFSLLEEAISQVFQNYQKALDNVEEIEKLESKVDGLERELIERLAARDDLSPGSKALYRDFLVMLADLSDIIENAGDEIEVIVALRRL